MFNHKHKKCSFDVHAVVYVILEPTELIRLVHMQVIFLVIEPARSWPAVHMRTYMYMHTVRRPVLCTRLNSTTAV